MRYAAGRNEGYMQVAIVVAALLIVVAAGALLLQHRGHNVPKTSPPLAANLSNDCVGKTFTTGGSGHCVRDIQTLINYMEHSGLTECSFINGATLPVNGTYDNLTAAQVLAVQHWVSCYARQEGFSSNIQQSGTVNIATWSELCTYGYTNPQHNGAKGAAASITAGKDAGCDALQDSYST